MRLGDLAGIDSDCRSDGLCASTIARSRRAMCSARSRARASTARISSPRRSSAARSRSSRGPRRGSRARRTSPTPSRGGFRGARGANSSRPIPTSIVAVTGTNGKTSTVEMTRQIVAHGGASLGVDRDAGRHHRRRPGQDRADHARHRHLPSQHGGAASGWGSAMSPTRPRPTASTSIAPRACR